MRRGGSGPVLRTVLFTDIVGSSEIASRLGDEGWGRLLALHHATIREALGRFRGREMDTAGDGFFAVFTRPADAIRCAWTAGEQMRSLGLEIRAGVHVGEAELMGSKIGGLAVNVAARVMALAGPGEIAVTATVREMAVGSGFGFSERGVSELKGIPGTWTLFTVTEMDGVSPRIPLDPAVVEERQRVAAQGRSREGNRRLIAIGAALGAAATVAALLVLALREGAPEPGPPDRSPDTASAAFPNAAEEDLLEAVPPAFSRSCGRAAEPAPGSRATVACSDGAVEVEYASYPSAEAMSAAFGALLTQLDLSPGGDCATDVAADDRYGVGGEDAGRVVCYRATGPTYLLSSYVAWTDEDGLILGTAVRPDPGDLSLYRWWATEGGPTLPGRPTAIKDVELRAPLEGTFGYRIRREEAGGEGFPGFPQPDHVGGWNLAISDDLVEVAQATAGEPFARERFAFAKDDRLVLLDYDHDDPAGCQPTLTLRWDLRGDRLTLRYDDGGCLFDARRAALTYKPWTRVA